MERAAIWQPLRIIVCPVFARTSNIAGHAQLVAMQQQQKNMASREKITAFFKRKPKSNNLEDQTDTVNIPVTENVGKRTNEPPTATILDEPAGPPKKSKYDHHFQSAWLTKYTWLMIYDKDSMTMKCKLCSDAGKSNSFTKGSCNYRTSTLTLVPTPNDFRWSH